MLRDLGPLQILLAVVGIGFLIAWHELGHYVVARLLGMRVLKYSIGFGPKLVGFKKNDIEYQIAALPLGGFVQIKGMTPLEEGAVGDPRSFIMRPRWARWLVLAAGPGFNYIMAALLFFVYLWMWPSPVDTPSVELASVAEVFPCKQSADCPGDWQCASVNQHSVCAPPGYDPAAGNLEALRMPASAAGLLQGDMITTVDGSPLADENGVAEFRARIAVDGGKPTTFHVLRGGQELDVQVTAIGTGTSYIIGVSPEVRLPRDSLFTTARRAVEKCGSETTRTLEAFGALFRREPGVEVGSPVMIVKDMKDKIAHGAQSFVLILAMLSVNLGLLNLLPVPSLDGVKMLFLTVEGTLRKDLNASFQVWVNAVGLLALLGLMVVLMARDTFKLLG